MKQNDEKILSALLTSVTIEKAAEKAGVTEKTVRNRLADDGFRNEYDQRRRSMVDNACRILQVSMSSAASVLASIMQDKKISPTARIAATRSVLDYGVKLTELTDLAARVAALETAAKEAGR